MLDPVDYKRDDIVNIINYMSAKLGIKRELIVKILMDGINDVLPEEENLVNCLMDIKETLSEFRNKEVCIHSYKTILEIVNYVTFRIPINEKDVVKIIRKGYEINYTIQNEELKQAFKDAKKCLSHLKISRSLNHSEPPIKDK